MTQALHCFHCGEPVPPGVHLMATLRSGEQPMCCEGCRAVAELIAGIGLEEFYRYRTTNSARPDAAPAAVNEAQDEWMAFDSPALAAQYVREEAPGQHSTVLLVDGIRCAACAWLIERALRHEAGVCDVSINAATARARIVWQHGTSLATLLRTISRLGYRPHPLDEAGLQQQAGDEQRSMLKRLGVAGLGMMQVMMYVLPLYSHTVSEMGADVAHYLRMTGLLLTTPVLMYSGWPFLRNAVRSVTHRSISMDVPVALALLLAYGASVYNTFTHQGEVYFDSVTMFIFLLTLGRYVEMRVRHRSNSVADALVRVQPRTAHRLNGVALQDVPVSQLQAGDLVRVRAGEAIPADGVIVEGSSRCNEAWLTGESMLVSHATDEVVMAGTVNVDAPLVVRVTAAGAGTVLSSVVALMQRAQTDKPHLARVADRIAAHFLKVILLVAMLTGVVWWQVDPTRAFDAVLAVLVVSCPCALSLATPAVIAAACSALARRGVLVARADAIERLASVSAMAFDKTGTLTHGRPVVTQVTLHGALSREHCLAVAAALEQSADHPIARALRQSSEACVASDVSVVAGRGVEGIVDGQRYRLGTPAFVRELQTSFDTSDAVDEAVVMLGDTRTLLASVTLQDSLRSEAPQLMEQLQQRHVRTSMLSGDALATVRNMAAACGITQFAARLQPADKLTALRELQRGAVVAMVGDGINDAPVLSAADVSIAMGSGTALAQASADVVLLRDSLTPIVQAIDVARAARRIMQQNLYWAAGYNLLAMPLAACGMVSPWLAAAGMSLSSVLVVLNALRLMTMRDTSATLTPSWRESHSWA